jgi:glycosyltransferase involved in cell wall biosynthesis
VTGTPPAAAAEREPSAAAAGVTATPGVVMLTGAYHPETSGASLQCRQLVSTLRDQVRFTVITTTTSRALPAEDAVDGVPLHRVFVDPERPLSKAAAVVWMARALWRARRDTDIVHLHGFSQKSMLAIALARLLRRKVLIKLTSFGHDDPVSMRRHRVRFWFFARADAYVAVSPRFERAHRRAGLPDGRLHLIPNGVNLERFRPVSDAERIARRRELALPEHDPLVLFVGFFSTDKRPDVLYDAWSRLEARGRRSTLVLVGATRGSYYEIDPGIAARIKADAEAKGVASRVVFVEHAEAIERYYQAADVFALPSLREGLPNVVLEAMASGVPPVVTRLEGVTDWLLEDGVHGRLVEGGAEELAEALAGLLGDPAHARAIGRAARQRCEADFGAAVVAARTLALYHALIARPHEDASS